MNILLVSPYIPFPPITGGKVRVLNFLRNLSRNNKVTLVCLLKTKEELQDISEIDKICYRVIPVIRKPAWSVKNLIWALFSRYSFLTIVNNFSKETEDAILQAYNEEKPDIIHLETFYMAQSFLAVKPHLRVPCLLSKVDVEAQVYFRNARVSHNPLLKVLGYIDARKMLNYEIDVCQYFEHISAASKVDEDLLNREMNKRGLTKPIEIIPNGVDTTHFQPVKNVGKKEKPTILFMGNFRYFANTDAVFYFIEEIYPRIKKKIPDVRFVVVGPRLVGGIQKNLSGDVGTLAREDITVTGLVTEEEKLSLLSSSWVTVAPIRIGSGTKLKILESMSMQLPVVATSVGIEGIEAREGEEVFVRDDPKVFADAVITLLQDEKKREEMGKSARVLMQKEYDWVSITEKLERENKRMIEKYG